ncbi:MAG: 2Fe-2S iron-sulfur cluster-binding protein, partial [Hyphomicrobiaceae bacterium]
KRELSTLPGEIRRWEELLARERIMRVMTAHVTVLPKRQTFEVVGDESILEAGLRAGIALPYGCSNGTCGDCKCRVVKGDVMRVRPHDYVLSAADKTQGYTLACSYSAVGDIEIDVSLWGVGDIPEQTIKTRVRSVERLGDRRIALHLLTPRAERLRYMAGQRVEITAAGQTRMVPAASCPCEERRIEVHVAWDEGDAWGTAAAALKTSEDVVVHGPFGSFVLDDESQRPMLLIAADHGFAPIKSLLQHALSLDHAPSISLYRLAGPDGLYQENLLKSYAGALDNFDYHAFENSAGHGALLGALGAALPDLSAFDVYAAGQEDFIAAVEAHCRTRGVTADRFRADAVT